MTDLSPAAQAVLDALGVQGIIALELVARGIAAAAIRAAADQAHPKPNIEDIGYTHQNYIDGWKDALDVILAIATELENLQ
jgi:hypothetical protein